MVKPIVVEATIETERKCRCCGEVKKILDFEIRHTYADGSRRYTHRCKACKNTYEHLRIKRKSGEYVPDELYNHYLSKKEDKLTNDEVTRFNVKRVTEKIKDEMIKKRTVKMRFHIEADLAEVMDKTKTNKSDLVNMLLRNHYRI